MNEYELAKEIERLTSAITDAARDRDRLWMELHKRWPTAFVNDENFIRDYNRAEAAAFEVHSLANRLVRASEIWNERYSGILPL